MLLDQYLNFDKLNLVIILATTILGLQVSFICPKFLGTSLPFISWITLKFSFHQCEVHIYYLVAFHFQYVYHPYCSTFITFPAFFSCFSFLVISFSEILARIGSQNRKDKLCFTNFVHCHTTLKDEDGWQSTCKNC